MRGLPTEILALSFPDIAVSDHGGVQVMHAEPTSGALSRLLSRIASIGAIIRPDEA